ncbi:hypothetical protein KAS31_04030 [Candidatus Parcubacteria bacterium]|nr:hypothetical protein [Candidatus Parcubacteria bacterium]
MVINVRDIAIGAVKEYNQMIEDCFKESSKPLENKIAGGLEVIEKINSLTYVPKRTRNQLKTILFHKLVELQKAETNCDVTMSRMGTTREKAEDCLTDLVNDIFKETGTSKIE